MKPSLERLLGGRRTRPGRREFLKKATALFGAAAGTFWADETLDAAVQNVNRNSAPSQLKITDLRVAVVTGAPFTCPIIRIDTNQGIYGLGEVRDGASKTYALMLKSRILGMNPCNIEQIFRRLRQFGGHGRMAGGVVAIEEACWDLAGKVYGVPIYQMLGGKYRDQLRCYCDTPDSPDPKVFGERMKQRKEMGFTWFKMDIGINRFRNVPGAVSGYVQGMPVERGREHTISGIEITHKGAELMAEYIMKVREIVGWDVPIAVDHVGIMGENSIIRLAKAFEKCNLAWLEDVIPWYQTEQLKRITDTVDVPICTGEDIYLMDEFEKLCRNHVVDIIHPDLSTSGGILETKRIGDMAMRYGIPMAMHMAGTPVCAMANAHCAAATQNFLVMENHSVDIPWWDDLVTGVEKPILNKGFIRVPEGPGLGIDLNEEVVKQHLMMGESYFAPTPEWDRERSADQLYS
ncbi:MAG: mandelate racemase/muconate lactonizing enzyme family protein [Bryobacteraceae bacterium]|nr:mandelate racemase/muconate lactonizing enzyme family protein [Bryobacteraceae bacterium]